MVVESMLPCFVCGKTLLNAFPDADNQPYEGTEFRTYGHYGSTFWDSFDGEELVLNVCDDCLRAHTERLAQHKRFRPVTASRVGMVGKHWVDRPMVPYTGNSDGGDLKIEPEEIGTDLPHTEWPNNAVEVREYAISLVNMYDERPLSEVLSDAAAWIDSKTPYPTRDAALVAELRAAAEMVGDAVLDAAVEREDADNPAEGDPFIDRLEEHPAYERY